MRQYETKLLRIGVGLVLLGVFLPLLQLPFSGPAQWVWFVAGLFTLVLGLIFFAASRFLDAVVNERQSYPSKPQKKEDFGPPVAWLLGRQLLSGLKRIALYSAYQDKLDLKDWMQANVEKFAASDPDGEEFWFDYLADTGDGQLPTYSMAYLCMSDIWTSDTPGVSSDGSQNAALDRTDQWSKRLPRGAFLFVGGDTAYHIADYATLAERFQSPFRWAHDDLIKAGKELEQRPVYGIPGNHDCYDLRDGFHRQFRRPITRENDPDRWGQTPQLSLPGFVRRQEASYVALRLPFGWWFWDLTPRRANSICARRTFSAA